MYLREFDPHFEIYFLTLIDEQLLMNQLKNLSAHTLIQFHFFLKINLKILSQKAWRLRKFTSTSKTKPSHQRISPWICLKEGKIQVQWKNK